MSSFEDDLILASGGHEHTCSACGVTRICKSFMHGLACDLSDGDDARWMCGFCILEGRESESVVKELR